MDFFLVFTIFAACFALMAIGYIVKKKILQKGCAMSPEECACRAEGKDPAECDSDSAKTQQQSSSNP